MKTSNLTSKALPAIGGGLIAKFVNAKVTPMISPATEAGKEPGMIAKAAPLLPAIVGVFMLNDKNDAMSYLGAGMIGASAGDTAQASFPNFLSANEDILADELDEFFEENMSDEVLAEDMED